MFVECKTVRSRGGTPKERKEMAKPWGALERPDEVTLAALTRTMTDDEIGKQFGVSRPAVAYWRKAAGIDRNLPPRMSHKTWLPWRVSTDHARHHVARMLRLFSTRDQGGALSSSETAQLERFLTYIDDHGVVVDYDPAVGFGWRKRRQGEKGPIRRPTDQ
jgi:hypothetical protein